MNEGNLSGNVQVIRLSILNLEGDAHMIRDPRRMQRNRLGVPSLKEGEVNDLHPDISSIKAEDRPSKEITDYYRSIIIAD